MSIFIKALKYAVISAAVFAICFTGGAYLTSWYFDSLAVARVNPEEEEVNVTDDEGKRTNILVLGVDARPGDTHARSDTMILASIDPELKKAVLVSVPRDTKVNINGDSNKICTANYYGGPELAVAKVEELMGIQIDNYVEVDFNGFASIIDTLGGVTLEVEQRMYKPSEGIDLQPGVQRLDGKGALAYVRYRDYVMGDIDRTAKQQKFLKALAGEVLQAKNIVKLPRLVNQLGDYVDTDLKISDMLRLASWAPRFSQESIITQTLPGYFYDEKDNLGTLLNSYWIADSKQARTLLDDLFAGKTVTALVSMPAEATSKVVKYYNTPANTVNTVADKGTSSVEADSDKMTSNTRDGKNSAGREDKDNAKTDTKSGTKEKSSQKDSNDNSNTKKADREKSTEKSKSKRNKTDENTGDIKV